MTNTAKSIIDKALGLNSKERAIIAEELLASLDVSDSSLDVIWAKEADARIEAFNRGEIEAVSVEEVFRKYQK